MQGGLQVENCRLDEPGMTAETRERCGALRLRFGVQLGRPGARSGLWVIWCAGRSAGGRYDERKERCVAC